MRAWTTMRACTANVGRGVTKEKFRRNIARIKRAAGPRACIFLQEVDEADVPDEMDDILWLFRWTHEVIGEQLAVPILVPKRIPTHDHQVRLGADGLAKFTPNRPINRVILELPIARPDRERFGAEALGVAAYNYHIPISRPETQTRRDNMVEIVQKEIREDKQAGLAGLWAADTNWRKARDGAWPRIVPGEVDVARTRVGTHAEIDRMKAWAAPGTRVTVRNRRTVDLTIDGHNGHIADVLWVPRKAA